MEASPAEILGFIASHEPLEKTLARFPGLTRERLRSVLREAAVLVLAEQAGGGEAEGQALCAPAPACAGQAVFATTERPAQTLANARPRAEQGAVAAGGTVVAPAAASQPRRLRLYCDGAARGNPGPAGAGAVLTKADGTIVARLGKFLGDQTNNFAEYTALLLGLEAALRLGADEIEVVADSELLVRQINGAYRVRSPTLKPLFERAQALLGRFRKSSVRHVPREQNKLADEMSNRAIDERM